MAAYEKDQLRYPHQSDDPVLREVASSVGKSPAERLEMFKGALELLEIAWRDLSDEERRARIEMDRKLDPSPVPWWKNLRPEARPNEGDLPLCELPHEDGEACGEVRTP